MSLFSNDDLAELSGFDKILQQKVANQKAAFITGYKEGYGTDSKELLAFLSQVSGVLDAANRHNRLQHYRELGIFYGGVMRILAVNSPDTNAAMTASDYNTLNSKVRDFLIDTLQNLQTEYPAEYGYFRVRMIKSINTHYSKLAGTNGQLDSFFTPLMQFLSKEPNVTS